MGLRSGRLIHRFLAALTILSFTLTQSLPAWSLRQEGASDPRIKEAIRAGLEEVLKQQTVDQEVFLFPGGSIQKVTSPTERFGGFDPLAGPGVISTVRLQADTGSGEVAAERLEIEGTETLTRLAQEGGWGWIYGVTLPDGSPRIFTHSISFHWPTVEGIQRAYQENPEANRQLQRWLDADVSALAAGIQREGNNSVPIAAALIRGCAFCATAGTTLAQKVAYDPHEQPLPIDRLAQVADILESAGIAQILNSPKPAFLLEDESVSVQLGALPVPQVTFRRVAEGKRTPQTVDLSPDQVAQVRAYFSSRQKAEGQREALIQRRPPLLKPDQEKDADLARKHKERTKSWETEWEANRRQREEIEGRRQALFGSIVAERFGSEVTFRNALFDPYAGGRQSIFEFLRLSRGFKRFSQFAHLFRSPERRQKVLEVASRLEDLIQREERAQRDRSEEITSLRDQEIVRSTLTDLKDVAWNLRNDVVSNVKRVERLAALERATAAEKASFSTQPLRAFWALTMLFNGVDKRMEARGRDSLGLSAMVTFENQAAFDRHLSGLNPEVSADFRENRTKIPDLADRAVVIRPGYGLDGEADPGLPVTVTFVYKVADVVGHLGDNAEKIRLKMIQDEAFQAALRQPWTHLTFILHSRWASAGIVNIVNAHPHDNSGRYRGLPSPAWNVEYGMIELPDGSVQTVAQFKGSAPHYGRMGTILTVENGDVENYSQEILNQTQFYPDLMKAYLKWKGPWSRREISPEITTDNKLIPLRIEDYVNLGYPVLEAVQRAGRDFDGSFAIQVISDLEPGKIYLAVNGKGQSLYVGISPDGFHPASEDFGFVDLTQQYIQVQPGQVVVVDDSVEPTLENLRAYRFDGTPVELGPSDLRRTTKTTRDVHLPAEFEHFFHKEVSASPRIIESTLFGKLAVEPQPGAGAAAFSGRSLRIHLGEEEFPDRIAQGIRNGNIRKVVFSGMGTAAAAAEATALALKYYLSHQKRGGLEESTLEVEAVLPPHFQAFGLKPDMSDTLFVAISQSGKTADTNQALTAAGERGAHLMGILNARESDASFEIERRMGGVVFTGTGRDIEISVASTMAYYAQVVAGVVSAMKIAQERGIPDAVLLPDAEELRVLPVKMESFLRAIIDNPNHPLRQVTREDGPFMTNPEWAVVGEGFGEAAATEVNTKLSELNYHTFFKTSTPNLKHIVYSAHPTTTVLAANVHGEGDFVQKNLPGELDKMLSHSLPVVLATTEDDHRFDNKKYEWMDAQGRKQVKPIAIIRVPKTTERFSTIFLTMAGHLLAYYLALEMNKRGERLMEALSKVSAKRRTLEETGRKGPQILEDAGFRLLVEREFGPLYTQIRDGSYNTGVRADQAVELAILVPFILGHMSLDRTEFYLGQDLSATELLDRFEGSVRALAKRLLRTIDSIPEQAKYVTVGVKAAAGERSGDVRLFVSRFREIGFPEQVVLDLSHGYQHYRDRNVPWTEVVPDPEAPLERSLLLVVSGRGKRTREQEQSLLVQIVRSQGVVAEAAAGMTEAFSDGEQGMWVSALPLARPLPALRHLGLDRAARERLAAIPPVEILAEELVNRFRADSDSRVHFDRVPGPGQNETILVIVGKKGETGLIPAISVPLDKKHTDINITSHGDIDDRSDVDISYFVAQASADALAGPNALLGGKSVLDAIQGNVDELNKLAAHRVTLRQALETLGAFLSGKGYDELGIRTFSGLYQQYEGISRLRYEVVERQDPVRTIVFVLAPYNPFPGADPLGKALSGALQGAVSAQDRSEVIPIAVPVNFWNDPVSGRDLVLVELTYSFSRSELADLEIFDVVENVMQRYARSPDQQEKEAIRGRLSGRHRDIENWFLDMFGRFQQTPRVLIEERVFQHEPGVTFFGAVIPLALAHQQPTEELLTVLHRIFLASGMVRPFVAGFPQETPYVAFIHAAFPTANVTDAIRSLLATTLQPYTGQLPAAGLEEQDQLGVSEEVEAEAARRNWIWDAKLGLYRTPQGGWVSSEALRRLEAGAWSIAPAAEISDGALVRGVATRIGPHALVRRSLVEGAVVLARATLNGAIVRTDPAARDSWAWNSAYRVDEVRQTVIGEGVAVGTAADGEPAEIVNTVIGENSTILGGSIRNSRIGADNRIVRFKVGLTHTEDNVTLRTKNGAPGEISESWIGWGRTIDAESYNEHLSPNLIRRAWVDESGQVQFATVDDIPAVVIQGFSTIDASYDGTGKVGKEFTSSRHGKGIKFPGSIMAPRVNMIMMVHPDFEYSNDFLRAESIDPNTPYGYLTALHPFSYSVQAADKTAGEVWGLVAPASVRRGLSPRASVPLWVFENARAALGEILAEMHKQVERHAQTAGWEPIQRGNAHIEVDNLPRYALETGKALARLAKDTELEARYDRHLAALGTGREDLEGYLVSRRGIDIDLQTGQWTLERLLKTDDPAEHDWQKHPLFGDEDLRELEALPEGIEISPDSQIGEGARVIGARARLRNVTIPAGATVFVWNSSVEGTLLEDGAQLRSGVYRGSRILPNAQLSNSRVTGPSSIGQGVKASGSVVVEGEIGAEGTLEPYARLYRTTVGRKGTIGSIAFDSRFGSAVTSHHLAGTRLRHVQTPDYNVDGKIIPNLTNISSGVRARGTSEQPVVFHTTMTGANMEIGPGVETGFASFVKDRLEANGQVPPFAFSRGPGASNKEVGQTAYGMQNMVMRLALGKTVKETPPDDRPKINTLVNDQLNTAGLTDQMDGRWELAFNPGSDTPTFVIGPWRYIPRFPGENQGYGTYTSPTAGLEEVVPEPEEDWTGLREQINLLPAAEVPEAGVGVVAAGLEDPRGLAYGVTLATRARTRDGNPIPVVFLVKTPGQAAGLEELGISSEAIYLIGSADYPDLEAAWDAANRWLKRVWNVVRVIELGVRERVSPIVQQMLEYIGIKLAGGESLTLWQKVIDQVEKRLGAQV